ncbi:MAG: tyrosine-type recombinase/integrase [Cyanobium sp.]
MEPPTRPAGLIQRYREALQARHYARRTVATDEQWLRALGLLFLYRELLERDMDLEGVVRASQKRRRPVVLTPGEVRAVLERMDGVEALVSEVLYGSGLRLMEALRLRVKDLDFERRELTVRDGKGSKDRRTMLPLG